MREILRERTANSKTYDKGGGLKEKVIYPYSKHFMKDGKWEEVVTDVKEKGNWEFTHAVEENSFKTYFHDSTADNEHLVGVEFEGKAWINLKLKDAKPDGVRTGSNEYTFLNCFHEVDVQYLTYPGKLKENIILNKSTAKKRVFTFTIKSEGIRVEKEGNAVKVKHLDTGEDLWYIGEPFMIDSEGEVSYGVEYELGKAGGMDTLTVRVTDEAFLSKATYPVYVDPTLEVPTFPEGAKANRMNHSSTGSALSQVYPRNPSMYVGSYSLSTGIMYGMVYMPEIQEFVESKGDVILISAKVDWYLDIRRSSRSYYIRSMRCKSEWNEDTLNYNNRNTYIDSDLPMADFLSVAVSTTYPSGRYEMDITYAVKKDLVEGAHYGLYLTYAANSGKYDDQQVTFYTSLNTDASLRPIVKFQYIDKPTIAFHDGTSGESMWYSDGRESIFKYLDFGTLVAGQTSQTKAVYMRNLSGFPISNTRLSLEILEQPVPEGFEMQVSRYNNPFIAEYVLDIPGVLEDEQDVPFYLRVVTTENTKKGSAVRIQARALPYEG